MTLFDLFVTFLAAPSYRYEMRLSEAEISKCHADMMCNVELKAAILTAETLRLFG